MDVVASLIGLAILSPLFIVVALAIIIDSWGSPLYAAKRIGKDGRPFLMWKFRTMVPGAAEKGPAITGVDDTRLTRLGPLLRRTKIDELPQLVNLLLGDVTLVGPRPEAPEIVALYSDRQRATLLAKPGITGPDQLDRGEESESIPAGRDPERYYVEHILTPKLERALEYLADRSIANDLLILARTLLHMPRALFTQRSDTPPGS